MDKTKKLSDEVLETLIEVEEQLIEKYKEKYHEEAVIDLDIVKALEELKDYRALGITPDQMREIDELYAEKCKEVEKYRRGIEKCIEKLA